MILPESRTYNGNWEAVSKRDPCRICGKTDWCSRIGDQVSKCMRSGEGGGFEKVDCSGQTYFIHVHRSNGTWIPPPLFFVRKIDPIPSVHRPEPRELDLLYTSLLRSLGLSPVHRRHLRDRGLSDEAIDRNGYATLPLDGAKETIRGIVNMFGEDVCRGVPGFQQNRWGTWALATKPGLLIPVRQVDGKIIAVRVRPDQPGGGGKYRWLSSPAAKSGSHAHVPLALANRCFEEVRVTEGELKADVTTHLDPIPTISIPGVGAWKSAIPALRALGASRVRIAFDRDLETNPNVASALDSARRGFLMNGFNVGVEIWSSLTQHPKKG